MLQVLLAVGLILSESRSAYAQASAPVPTQPTIFTTIPQSLTTMLNDGWTIQSISGDDGNITVLHKDGKKWARCELFTGNDLKLRFAQAVYSDCRALN